MTADSRAQAKQVRSKAAYAAQRRERLSAAGLCIQCGKVPSADTDRYCADCREYHRAYGRNNYPKRRGELALSKEARRQQRVEAGLCYYCGNHPSVEPGTKCLPCREDFRRRHEAFTARERAKAEAGGLCFVCRALPRTDGRKSCEPCRLTAKQRREAHAAMTTAKGVCRDCAAEPVLPKNTLGLNCRNRKMSQMYGLTVEQYVALGSGCGICSTDKDLVVDHDHATEAVRGLLCSKCNKGLGWFRDHPELLRKAAEYLERGKGP